MVRVQVPGRTGIHTGFLRDLSRGGMFVRLVDPEPQGARFRFTLRLSAGARGGALVRGEAEVAWVREGYDWPGQPPGMAVRFLGLEEPGRSELARVLGDEPLAPPLPPSPRESWPVGAWFADRTSRPAPGVASLQDDDPEPAPVPEAVTRVPMRASAARPRRRRRRMLLATGVAAALLLAAGWAWRSAGGGAVPAETARGGAAARPPGTAGVPASAARRATAVTAALGAGPGGAPPSRSAAAQATAAAAAPRAPAAGELARPASRLLELRWERHATGTRAIARFDGTLDPRRVRSSPIGGESPRQVLQLRGIAANPPGAPWQPATPELQRVRAGHHLSADGGELHLVLDLAGPGVRLVELRAVGDELRLELAPR